MIFNKNIQNEFIKHFNNPNIRIVGGKSDFITKFNDSKTTIKKANDAYGNPDNPYLPDKMNLIPTRYKGYPIYTAPARPTGKFGVDKDAFIKKQITRYD
jgi:hypothetical protein